MSAITLHTSSTRAAGEGFGLLGLQDFEARFGNVRALSINGYNEVCSALTATHYVYFDHAAGQYRSERR